MGGANFPLKDNLFTNSFNAKLRKKYVINAHHQNKI